MDEKCARLGITYLKWQGQKRLGMHISHVPTKKLFLNMLCTCMATSVAMAFYIHLPHLNEPLCGGSP